MPGFSGGAQATPPPPHQLYWLKSQRLARGPNIWVLRTLPHHCPQLLAPRSISKYIDADTCQLHIVTVLRHNAPNSMHRHRPTLKPSSCGLPALLAMAATWGCARSFPPLHRAWAPLTILLPPPPPHTITHSHLPAQVPPRPPELLLLIGCEVH